MEMRPYFIFGDLLANSLASGRVVTQWPKNMSAFRDMIAELNPEAYESEPNSTG